MVIVLTQAYSDTHTCILLEYTLPIAGALLNM